MRKLFVLKKSRVILLRSLLVVLLMAAMGQMQAQDDVYTAGYYTNEYSRHVAAVYKNETLLYSYDPGSGSDYWASAVAVDPATEDVYWVRTREGDNGWSDIYKNNSLYLNNTSYTEIYDLCFSDGHLYAMGKKKYGNEWRLACWKDNNATPILTWSDDGINWDIATGQQRICVNNGNVYMKYYVYDFSHNSYYNYPTSKIMKNGTLLYEFEDHYISDIDYYDEHLYLFGYEVVRDDNDNAEAYINKVWRDNNLLYTLNSSGKHQAKRLSIVGGDLYTTISDWNAPEFMRTMIHRNGSLHTLSNQDARISDASSHGVYTLSAYEKIGNVTYIRYRVFKDGIELFRIGEDVSLSLLDMVVVEQCGTDDTRALPYTESFEGLTSDWACWTKYDLDNNNAGYPSYWDRFGNGVKGDNAPSAFSGNNCAKHRYLSTAMQNGLLVSPRLFLQPNRSSTTLSFWSYEQYPDDCQYEAVAISTTGNAPSDFSDIWTQSNATATWKHVTLDLSAYQGETVYIAFRYGGQNGHNWYIDNVEVTESDGQCYTEGYLPYNQTFDYEMGPCWYVIDADMSGGKKCWKWSSDNQCVYHPYGQQNVPQEGWLISRPISLWQEDYGYTLSFKSKSTSSGTGRRNSVWISVDQSSSNPPDPAEFTEIWVDPSYSSNWTEYEIDLSAYAGHNVNIAFKYEGTWAHNWFIDDFSVNKFSLYYINATANPSNGGMVSGAGYYMPGATCTLTATAEYGYSFENWTKNGTAVSTDPIYTFTVNNHGNYVANFTSNEYTVEAIANPTSGGTVTGGGSFAFGADCTLTATANPGYSFVNWTLNGEVVFTNPIFIFVVTEDGTYVANFEQTGGSTTQTTNFVTGWNWWSSYIELDNNSLNVLQDGLGTNGLTIKSQGNGFNSYMEGLGWYGSLTSINNESCYQVKTSAPCTVSMTGSAANPTDHPITLNANGWTWIGYPVSTNMSLTEAFSGFTPASGDMVKSQSNGYASYLEGLGWYGALTTLNPGMGLMYKSVNSSSIIFRYPSGGSKGELKPNQTAEHNHWVPNLTAYPDNMSVMAVVELDGEELQGENYELAAFANGECRGSAKLMYVAPLNRYCAFLTVAGDEAVELHFALYDAETGAVEMGHDASLQYETNAIIGSFETPYVVRFRSTTGVDEWANSLQEIGRASCRERVFYKV